jgi:hypothetical protein
MNSVLRLILTVLLGTVTSCNMRLRTEASADYSCKIRAIRELQDNADRAMPKHIVCPQEAVVLNGSEFDPGKYFGILKHVRMEGGTILDYVYYFRGGNGYPYLYARSSDMPRHTTYAGLERNMGGFEQVFKHRGDWLTKVKADGTPESFLELVILREMASQFYLQWHACYNDRTILISTDDIRQQIAALNGMDDVPPMTAEQEKAALRIDPKPIVEVKGDSVKVIATVFSKWSGLMKTTYSIRREYPHEIKAVHTVYLITYNCGIMF